MTFHPTALLVTAAGAALLLLALDARAGALALLALAAVDGLSFLLPFDVFRRHRE